MQHLSEVCFRWGVVLFAVLLPLETVPNKLISVLSAGVTLLLLPYALLHWRRLLRPRWAAIFFTPLVAVWTVWLLPLSVQPTAASLRTFTILLVRAWLIACLVEKKHLQLFERATYVVAGAVVLFGLYQYVGDLAGLSSGFTFLKETYSSSGTYAFPRVHSFAREPLLLANYLFIPLAFLVVRIIKRGRPLVYEAVLSLSIIGLLLTLNSRGAFLAAGVAALIIIATSPRFRGLLRRYAFWLVAAAVLSLSLVAAAVSLGGDSLGSYIGHTFESDDASFMNRVATWRQSVDIIAGSPLFGVGLGNSTTALSGTAAPLPDGPVFNNTYFTLIAELGLIGVLAFIPLGMRLIRLITVSVRERFSATAAAYGVMIMTYAVQAATYEGLLNLRLWAVIGFAIAALRLYNEAHYEDRH